MNTNNIFAQTYDSITKQGEMIVNPSTNKFYVANSGSNTVSILDSDSGNLTDILVGTSSGAVNFCPCIAK